MVCVPWSTGLVNVYLILLSTKSIQGVKLSTSHNNFSCLVKSEFTRCKLVFMSPPTIILDEPSSTHFAIISWNISEYMPLFAPVSRGIYTLNTIILVSPIEICTAHTLLECISIGVTFEFNVLFHKIEQPPYPLQLIRRPSSIADTLWANIVPFLEWIFVILWNCDSLSQCSCNNTKSYFSIRHDT